MAEGDRLPDRVERGPSCARCGVPFRLRLRAGRGTRFCSAACRVRWHAEERRRRLAEIEGHLTDAVRLVREMYRD